MIPKIIHYVWVGDNPLGDLERKCMASWKKHCPDYQIVHWGNESLKEIDNAYVAEAYKHKKWAFVSDYLRLYALKEYGGFYFDTDLEITQPIDKFISHNFVMGYESYSGKILPGTAFIGAEKSSSLISNFLNEYEKIHFETSDGEIDLTPNTKRMAQFFSRNFGLKIPKRDDVTSVLQDGAVIYPPNYFCLPISDKTNYAIHHFSGSWSVSFTRKLFFKLLETKFIRIKKKEENLSPKDWLRDDETLLMEIPVSKRTSYVLIRETRSKGI